MAIGIDTSFWTTTYWSAIANKYMYGADFDKIQDEAFQFIIPRASGGNALDPGFYGTMDDIAPRPWYKGAYHFFDPRINALVQANMFANALKNYKLEIPPVLDLEADYGLSNTVVINAATTFVNEAEALLGRKLMIYTGPWWFDTYMYIVRLGIKVWPAWCANHDLWISNPYSGKPTIPKAFKTWVLWQYTFQISYPGLLGAADGNKFNGTDAQFYEKYGPIPPPPVPVKTGKVLVSNLNIRTGPGQTYMITGQKNYGDIVTIYETRVIGSLTWVKIYNSSTAELWCCSVYYGALYIDVKQSVASLVI